MGLKITLKPHERMIIGGAIVSNGDGRADIFVENKVPILREKDILRQEEADSPCKRLYFSVQLMYVDEKNLVDHHHTYWELVKDILNAAPSAVSLIDEISSHILSNQYYQALKTAQRLIEYEKEVLESVH